VRDDRNDGMKDGGMDEFEQSLRRAMRRVDVRAETTRKFLAIAAEAEAARIKSGRWTTWFRPASGGRVLAMPRVPAWGMAALAAMVVLGVFGGEQVHRQTEQRKAADAQRQFDAGVRITDHALDQTRAQLEKAGFRIGR
jgi:hypothetical protein